jgi:hypothetical protein
MHQKDPSKHHSLLCGTLAPQTRRVFYPLVEYLALNLASSPGSLSKSNVLAQVSHQ